MSTPTTTNRIVILVQGGMVQAVYAERTLDHAAY